MESYLSVKTQSWLAWFVKGVTVVVFLVIFSRIFELQIVKGKYYRMLAEENRIRKIPITAPRGRIFARSGEILVDNEQVEISIIYDKEFGYTKQENLINKPKNTDVIKEWVRVYKMGDGLAHLTGYVGEAAYNEVEKVSAGCPEKGVLKLGSWTGRGGLEETYECRLRGLDGEELFEVDAMGKKVRELGTRKPIPGEDIHTTIDLSLQKKTAEVMKNKEGAVVITDIKGEILALYSSPSYDPNDFIKGDNYKISSLLTGSDKPLFNRVIAGGYHPGSVFKPFVALSALQEGIIDENFTFNDPGVITITSPYGNFSFSNWYYTQYGGKEGNIGLERAIARSTDTFFYKVGEAAGADNIFRWAQNFGLGKLTGIALPGEVEGLIPNQEWKIRTKNERWFLGDTYNMSIGQGDVILTPIELNMGISAIASGGELCTPVLLKDEITCKRIEDVETKYLDVVKKGMEGACSTGGTAYSFFDYKINVACKTGTAQTGEKTDPHAWFTAFAPIDEPQIVTTVLIVNGGEGSKVAAPIMKEIFDFWFDIQNPSEDKD